MVTIAPSIDLTLQTSGPEPGDLTLSLPAETDLTLVDLDPRELTLTDPAGIVAVITGAPVVNPIIGGGTSVPIITGGGVTARALEFTISTTGVINIPLAGASGTWYNLYVNGLIQSVTAYIVTTELLTLPPDLVWVGAFCRFEYLFSSTSPVTIEVTITVPGDQTIHLPTTAAAGWYNLFVNGLVQSITTYVVSGSQLHIPGNLVWVNAFCRFEYISN
jgi:hypothetical protein